MPENNPRPDFQPAHAVHDLDRLTAYMQKRWPDQKLMTAEVVDAAISKLEATAFVTAPTTCNGCCSQCTAAAAFRIIAEKAVSSLHLKYNGKPVTNGQAEYQHGDRLAEDVCDAHLSVRRDHLIAEAYSVSVGVLT